MNKLDSDIERAVKRCKSIFFDSSHYTRFEEIYPFTTENISGYIDNFDLMDKSLLTVGSSGDQVLNAIARKCSDISIIDINPYAKYYYYLKAAGILELSRDEFLNFYRYVDYPKPFKRNRRVFNKEEYEKIKYILKELDYGSYLFWNELFSQFSGERIRNQLFSLDENKTSVIRECNVYLNDVEYNDLRNRLYDINPNFITGDIITSKIDGQFDNIWLSNVGQYLSISSFRDVIDKVSSLLGKDGLLLISYLYQTVEDSDYIDDWAEIYDLDTTLRVLSDYKPEFVSFLGIRGIVHDTSDYKDSILIYKNN